MASPHTNDFDFPHFPPPPSHPFLPPPPSAAKPPSPSRFRPPPPFHPVTPPPPHVRPPPPPTPDNHPTVIVIVFISVGGIFFFAFLAAALFCFINKKKKKKTVQETEIIHVDEHRNVHEAIIPRSHGSHAVILSIDDDIHIDEKIGKKEELGEDLHGKSTRSKSGILKEGGSSSSFDQHHFDTRKNAPPSS